MQLNYKVQIDFNVYFCCSIPSPFLEVPCNFQTMKIKYLTFDPLQTNYFGIWMRLIINSKMQIILYNSSNKILMKISNGKLNLEFCFGKYESKWFLVKKRIFEEIVLQRRIYELFFKEKQISISENFKFSIKRILY